MKSYARLYQRLPRDFLDSISDEYTPNELDRIYAGYMSDRPVTLRVNALKSDIRSVMDIFRSEDIKFERVLWYDDALIIRNRRERDLEGHRLYTEGKIYLQSLSSMIPPAVLNLRKGWKVLDLTAAPGSKTTQIASIMGDDGFILANEINKIRFERLEFNIGRQGAGIVRVRYGDGKKLEPEYQGYFDAVLLDAPCSGTGLFSLGDARTYRAWSVKRMRRLVGEQRGLLSSALRCLKTGGSLVYSTCSMMREENEDNVSWMLKKYRDSIDPERIGISLSGPGVDSRMLALPGCAGNMMLVFPSSLYEGFFISKFKKTGTDISNGGYV